MNKRFISVLLVVAIVFSAISVLATENNETILDISDNNYPAKQNISVNINDLPHIYESNVQVLPSDNAVSLLSQDTFDEWDEATNTRIPFNSIDNVDVPSNKFTSDEEWVSSNEIDNEDAKKINELQQSQLEAFNKKMSSNTTSTRASRNISSVPS
ncbi:MAG: hypothetical protein IKV64_02860, partial [Clostridia bacterium]|nr:hypothetical protein [Clostridia bacterium]